MSRTLFYLVTYIMSYTGLTEFFSFLPSSYFGVPKLSLYITEAICITVEHDEPHLHYTVWDVKRKITLSVGLKEELRLCNNAEKEILFFFFWLDHGSGKWKYKNDKRFELCRVFWLTCRNCCAFFFLWEKVWTIVGWFFLPTENIFRIKLHFHVPMEKKAKYKWFIYQNLFFLWFCYLLK